MAKATDQKTLDLIKEVTRKKAEIAKIGNYNNRTNCSFSYIEGKSNDAINIHVADVKTLICIAAFLRDRENSYGKIATELGVETPPEFTWGGFSTLDWFEDIKMRINKIQISSKKKKLEVLESRLNAIISPELRAKMELEAIASELE